MALGNFGKQSSLKPFQSALAKPEILQSCSAAAWGPVMQQVQQSKRAESCGLANQLSSPETGLNEASVASTALTQLQLRVQVYHVSLSTKQMKFAKLFVSTGQLQDSLT